jgi:hypothetical protein
LLFGGLWLGLLFGFGLRLGHSGHDNDEITFLDGKFLDGVLIVGSFAFEDNLKCICS